MYHARSAEMCTPADYYLYCPWAADSTAPVLVVPASWPPEPEEPPGAGDEAEGADPQVSDGTAPDVWVSGDAGDADAETDAGARDAGAEADAEADTDEEAGTFGPPARSTDGVP
jgi:hypothetical protein